jgi:signal peptidase I
MANKDIVIKRFSEESVNLIKNEKNISIYVWKEAIMPWHEVEEFIELIKLNNIDVIYFDDKENYLNKPQWVIVDKDNNYWTGSYAQHPFGGRARLFLQFKSYAKKYFSKEIAERSAKKMANGREGKYFVISA